MLPILFGVLLAVIYCVLYYQNQKTPPPEGCEIPSGFCASCSDEHCEIRV